MTPIFALYKKWQQRQASNPKKEKSPSNAANSTASNAKNSPPQAIPRPSELYFQKLTPLLNKHNIKATQSSRKEWPLQALKEVLAELTGTILPFQLTHKTCINIIFCSIPNAAETPRDLLSKELWYVDTFWLKSISRCKELLQNFIIILL